MSEISADPSVSNSATTSTAATGSVWDSRKIIFDKYEVGRVLGCGASAIVYHARDVHTGRSVAVKAFSKRRVELRHLEENIKREIMIMSRLRHPNVIRIIEVLATKTKIYLVMEFAKGGELFSKVNKGVKGRFNEDLSRLYFHQLISAVGYCHSRGVYHRDLKPENILFDEYWNLKIADFGFAAVKEQIRPNGGGMLQTLCGTPSYVAPEVLARKGYDGAKVDIWSCGVILFLLAAGRLPFFASNTIKLYRKIYQGDFQFARCMSSELRKLLSRLLETNPAKRITIDELRHDLWFKKGYKEINFSFNPREDVEELGSSSDDNSRYLNAFDLMAYSPGLCLSGMFMESVLGAESSRETYLTAEEPVKLVEAVEEAARGIQSPKVEVGRTKGGMGVRVEGHDGNFGVMVEIRRLTEELAVVEIRKREKDMGPSHHFWEDNLKPLICHLFSQSGLPAPSS